MTLQQAQNHIAVYLDRQHGVAGILLIEGGYSVFYGWPSMRYQVKHNPTSIVEVYGWTAGGLQKRPSK